jgi:hypothetical protein
MIPLWLRSSFDLLVHGELHYTLPEEFDRRVALVSFDNAIESAIACYLGLHESQRGNRQYKRVDVEVALVSFHSKLDFLYQEVVARKVSCHLTKQDMIYIHKQRSLFYHENPDYVPAANVLSMARESAFWVFSFLFEVQNLEELVQDRIKQIRKLDVTPRDREIDDMIDQDNEVIEILGLQYKPSEVLYAVDPVYYRQFVEDVKQASKDLERENVGN